MIRDDSDASTVYVEKLAKFVAVACCVIAWRKFKIVNVCQLLDD